MLFGDRIRELRENSDLTQNELAECLGVSTSYVNKCERGRLHFGDYPSAKFIHRLAEALQADEDELLLLADKVPAAIRKRIQPRPEAFRKFAELDDGTMDRLLQSAKKSSHK